ncbi:acetolactate synthase [Basidiobolus meristosporus CBS 931.73]|uniref:Acetolactate synthase n=1 Tax=Basidiobolus meristosporus CBS 931.73 TaxID=1314790 RepID=A0A1Y1YYL9_9FUNG|nr:acetolactate synthase [Basidiobolus meristosporus CBS 931.73]|eukprot:ORY03122.1 acetolactate synthase [Basidiobolus meristosporus CBS 931.73]
MVWSIINASTRQRIPSIVLGYSTSDNAASDRKSDKPQPRFKKLPALPNLPTLSAKEAVSNIVYNTPPTPSTSASRHVLNCLVQNEPGVLSRVTGILAARGFNIDSLVVAKTEVPDLSRMTIVLIAQDTGVEQAMKQLEDLTPVWAVLDYTNTKMVERELLLVKVSVLGADHEQAIIHGEPNPESDLSPGMRLLKTHENLNALNRLTEMFRGQMLDVSNDCVTIQVPGKSSRIDAFMKLVQPFGILEASRSGMMAMPRSMAYHEEEEEFEEQSEQVDATMLPPG